VNISGWLSLESWVTPSLFADSGALDEVSLVGALGPEAYGLAVLKHRAAFIGADDFVQIAARGFNAVRLPVPWYAFGDLGPAPGPYVGCVDYVDRAFDWAEEVGLKILVLLDVSPGPTGSGLMIKGSDDFATYREDLLDVVAALAKRYAYRDGFYGIEVANNPVVQQRRGLTLSDGIPAHMLRNYYRSAYEAVREVAGDDPIVVIPEAGMGRVIASFMAQRRYHNVMVDCHILHHVARVDSTGPMGVRSLIADSNERIRMARRSGHPVLVGEWSGSLPYADSVMTPEGRIAMERVFISEQLAAYRSCDGWFFQTWKTEAHPAGWDARVALGTFERRMLA